MKLFHLGLCVNEYPHDGLRRGLQANCTEYKELNCGVPNVNALAVEICNDFRPDIVFMQIQSAGVIAVETMQRMRQMGAFVINWTGDVRNEVPLWMQLANHHVSVTAFSNMRDVRSLQGAEYLEIGYDLEIFKPDGEQIPVKPIVFMGNHYGHFPMSDFRMDMVNSMKGVFGDQFGVYGNNGERSFNNSQLDESAAYRSAKIGINVSHYEIEKYSSDRLLRIMGSGCLCLCKDYPGMPFKDGEHLIVWRSLDQLQQLCKWYLSHPDEANEIAKRGQEYVLENHSYTAMGKNIVDIWNRRKNT